MLSKERVVLAQVTDVLSVVDIVHHFTTNKEMKEYSKCDFVFDIEPSNLRWADIPLSYLYSYDITTRLHSPNTLRVFFSYRELKNNKKVKSTLGKLKI